MTEGLKFERRGTACFVATSEKNIYTVRRDGHGVVKWRLSITPRGSTPELHPGSYMTEGLARQVARQYEKLSNEATPIAPGARYIQAEGDATGAATWRLVFEEYSEHQPGLLVAHGRNHVYFLRKDVDSFILSVRYVSSPEAVAFFECFQDRTQAEITAHRFESAGAFPVDGHARWEYARSGPAAAPLKFVKAGPCREASGEVYFYCLLPFPNGEGDARWELRFRLRGSGELVGWRPLPTRKFAKRVARAFDALPEGDSFGTRYAEAVRQAQAEVEVKRLGALEGRKQPLRQILRDDLESIREELAAWQQQAEMNIDQWNGLGDGPHAQASRIFSEIKNARCVIKRNGGCVQH